MRLALRLWTSVLAGALLALAGAEARAQSPNDLFDPETLQDVRILMHSRDVAQLIARFDENIYFAADLEWHGVRARNVAVRSRGSASRSQSKPGLHLDFGRYVTGGRFFGLGSLVLDNTWHDPTLLREFLAMHFFRQMGLPAPRVSLGRVYVNNVYYGVYSITEDLNADFLERTFEDPAGFLFEFRQQQDNPFLGGFLGDAFAPYNLRFEPRTRRLEADATLYGPLRDLLHEINQPPDAVWRERVDALLDLEQFVRVVAVEQFLWEQDGLLGSVGMNNFYLYRPAGSRRHLVLPWDKDLTFIEIYDPTLVRRDDNELFLRAMTYPDLRELYHRTIGEAAFATRADEWLHRMILNGAALIDAAVREDVRKPFSDEAFEEGVAFLLEFAQERPRVMLEALAQLPRDP